MILLLQRTAWVAVLSLLSLSIASLASAQETDTDAPATIQLAGKAFTESNVLMELMAQMIEAHTELTVERTPSINGSQLTAAALLADEIDIYAEYTGTAWYNQMARTDPCSPLHCFSEMAQYAEQHWGARVMSPFGFNNTYAIAVRRPLAEERNLRTISDLKRLGDGLRIALSHEFLARPDGWPGLAETYGLEHVGTVGVEHAIVYDALLSGTLDVVEVYSTDGKLDNPEIVLLKDDLNYFPPYHAVPVVRTEIYNDYPEVVRALELLAWSLSDLEMSRLNRLTEESGGDFSGVASTFLRARGLIGETDGDLSTGPSSLSFKIDASLIARQAWRHLLLTLMAVLLACAFALPVAMLLVFHPRHAGWVIGTTSTFQTIPGLALLAILVATPAMGLGMVTAITAIWVYALLPILRNAYVGLTEVDLQLLDVATALGMTPGQVLRFIRIPLAVPTIMAGVRTATVISVGVTTLAAFVGAGGLGELILTGLQLTNRTLILSGALPAALMALIIDRILAGAQTWLAPGGLGEGTFNHSDSK